MALPSGEFAVVEFPEEDNCLGIVHRTWLRDTLDRVLWPGERNPSKRRKMIIDGAQPEDTWVEVKCVVKGLADIYEKAVERLQCLQYSSDANSERELGRGKRKRRPAVMSDYDDESPNRSDTTASDEEDYVPPKPPTPPALPKRTSVPDLAAVHAPHRRTNRSQLRVRCSGTTPSPVAQSLAPRVQDRDWASTSATVGIGNQHGVGYSQADWQSTSATFGNEHTVGYSQADWESTSATVGYSQAGSSQACVSPYTPASSGLQDAPTPVHRGSRDSSAHSRYSNAPITVRAALEDPAAQFNYARAPHNPIPRCLDSSRLETDPQLLAFMQRILTTLNEIKLTQQKHSQCLAQLLSGSENEPHHSQEIPQLPFAKIEDLLEFDEELSRSKEARAGMKKHMVIQGGNSAKQKASRILKSLLPWDVAVEFSWFGAKGKKKFCELNICKLMCTVLTDNKAAPATLKEVEQASMSWFRHAAERAAAPRRQPNDPARPTSMHD
ncbi:uncharacterized protein LOC144176636 isoform X2 [Haemaphysalis longicornis]